MVAVVTQESTLSPVIGKRQAAVLATEALTAGATKQDRRITSAIAQDDHLITGGNRGHDFTTKARGKVYFSGTQANLLSPQVDQNTLG